MLNKKVSIIVPCYNQSHFLSEALQSVLEQSYSNWECLIVDDGSPDNTEEVALKWCETDERFIYFKKENEGLSAARNSGIENANGEFILPLDADDKISPNYIELATNCMMNDVSLSVVYCNAEKFGDENGFWKLPNFSLQNLSRNNIIFPCAMYKKETWERVGGYDSKMIYGWEDWEFWIAILKNGGKAYRLSEVGFYYRIKDDSMLKKIDKEKGRYLLEYLSVKHADFFVKHYGSFKHMEELLYYKEFEFEQKVKSKKFLLNQLFKVVLNINLFKKYR